VHPIAQLRRAQRACFDIEQLLHQSFNILTRNDQARKGINPFTKEPTIFKAKPARKVIRARPVKAVKDAVA
jgi:hypothetical protein